MSILRQFHMSERSIIREPAFWKGAAWGAAVGGISAGPVMAIMGMLTKSQPLMIVGLVSFVTGAICLILQLRRVTPKKVED